MSPVTDTSLLTCYHIQPSSRTAENQQRSTHIAAIFSQMASKEDTGKQYRLSCTGDALRTVENHSEPEGITFFGACFCPFVQRVWIALEYFQIPYRVSGSIIPMFRL